MKQLRIMFTLISAVFIAAVIPLGAIVSWTWAGACALLAFLFYGLMLICKQKQEEQEEQQKKLSPPAPPSDGRKNERTDEKTDE